MKIDNSFDVPLPAAEAWRVLMDIERVARCLPGAELTEKLDAQTYRGRIALRLGPVALAFSGTARIDEADEEKHRARITASGTEAKGRGGAAATAEFALSETSPCNTRVAVRTDLALNGAVAQYGRGAAIIAGVAQELIDRFAAALKIEIEGSALQRVAAREETRRGVSAFALAFGTLWRLIKRHLPLRLKGATH
jgi:uncharacterized protein